MECGHCQSETNDGVICSVCNRHLHAACTRLGTVEKWTRMALERRGAWKCDSCSPGNLDPTHIYEQINDLRTHVARLSQENTELKNRIIALETRNRTGTDNQAAPILDAHSGDRIPQYIENELIKVPRLCTDNPWTLINFLDKLHLLNGMNEHLFKPIFQRLATYQQNSVLLRLATSDEPLTFTFVAKELLDELTTPHTQLKLVQSKILRPQFDSENFRTYVEQVMKFNKILSQYSETDLVKCILQGANTHTRAKFNFSTKPKTFIELQALVADVEKLELTETMQKSQSASRRSPQTQYTENYSRSAPTTPKSYGNFESDTDSPRNYTSKPKTSNYSSRTNHTDARTQQPQFNVNASPKSLPK
ncbi:unnamed protein product, partial [Nesidiocoris tenuis]